MAGFIGLTNRSPFLPNPKEFLASRMLLNRFWVLTNLPSPDPNVCTYAVVIPGTGVVLSNTFGFLPKMGAANFPYGYAVDPDDDVAWPE